MTIQKPRITAKIAGRPLHPLLRPFAIGYFLAVCLCDLVYSQASVFAQNDAPGFASITEWLLVAGLVTAGLAAIVALIDLLGERQFRTLPDGLKILDVQDGDPNGVAVKTGDEVQVYYTGWLTNGTVFDSRRSPANPASFTVTTGAGGVIPGFAEGLVGMKPGGIRQLIIPPELAYGNNPPNGIPVDATLVFEVKLISVESPTT